MYNVLVTFPGKNSFAKSFVIHSGSGVATSPPLAVPKAKMAKKASLKTRFKIRDGKSREKKVFHLGNVSIALQCRQRPNTSCHKEEVTWRRPAFRRQSLVILTGQKT